MNYPIIEDVENFVYEKMPPPPANYEEYLYFDKSYLYELEQKTKTYKNCVKDANRKISELARKLKNNTFIERD